MSANLAGVGAMQENNVFYEYDENTSLLLY